MRGNKFHSRFPLSVWLHSGSRDCSTAPMHQLALGKSQKDKLTNSSISALINTELASPNKTTEAALSWDKYRLFLVAARFAIQFCTGTREETSCFSVCHAGLLDFQKLSDHGRSIVTSSFTEYRGFSLGAHDLSFITRSDKYMGGQIILLCNGASTFYHTAN